MFQGWKEVSREQVLYVLSQLELIFADQDNWLDFPEACDEHGNSISPMDSKVVKWSLSGASERIAREKFDHLLSAFVDCATRDFLSDLYEESLIGKMLPYADEYALICLAYEHLSKEKI